MNLVQKKTETQKYRAIEKDSYSTLKTFVDQPMQYYKENILGEKRKENKNSAIILGDVVDCLLFTPEDYYDKFEENNCGEIDKNKTTQIGLFTLELLRVTKEATNEDGQCTISFLSRAEEAFNNVKFDYNGNEVAFKKKELEFAIENFTNSKFEEWFNVQLKGMSKTLVDRQSREQADRIVERLRNSQLSHLLQGENTFFQQQMEYEFNGCELKSMLDIIHIDEENKKIHGIDLKCSWEILDFQRNYIKNKYYIQAACYTMALLEYVKTNLDSSYTLGEFSFLVADSSNLYEPLLYKLGKLDLEAAIITGFYLNGKYYQGLAGIVEDLQWAKETGNFRIKKQDYLEGAVRKLHINYDKHD